MSSLSELASGDEGAGALTFPYPFPPVVGSLVAFIVDAAAFSLIFIPLVHLRGGMSLPATFGQAMSAKTSKRIWNSSSKCTEK